jgi:hypothetical protein
MLGHKSIQMTMRYVHPAEEQKRVAAGKLENFRLDGIMQAADRALGVPAKVPTVN